MLIRTPAETSRGSGTAARDAERAEEVFTEASASPCTPRPRTETDDVVLLSRPVRETPLDLIDDGSWSALDLAVGAPGHDKAARAGWIEASARRLLIDGAFRREIEWLANMGNDAARSAIDAARKVEAAKSGS